MGLGSKGDAPAALPPGKRFDTHFIGGWVSTVRKISSPRGFDPRTVQPVASRYTNYVFVFLYKHLVLCFRVISFTRRV